MEHIYNKIQNEYENNISLNIKCVRNFNIETIKFNTNLYRILK